MEKFSTNDLTKAGFVHTPDLDFEDDGTNFKMYTYKGVPVSYAEDDENNFYVCIRLDYLTFPFDFDYSKLVDYKVTNEFNGVETVDIDKLVANVEATAAILPKAK